MKLIVQQTLERLESVQQLILSIAQYDFPFDDSRDALDAIEQLIAGQVQQLEDQISESSDDRVARTFCERASDDITNALPVLGLIVRSAEPIGALELQWPLKQLTKRALADENAKLVISSDWNYSPFTLLPTQIENKKIVLVGMPVSEANNALVAPLAGHELGHNIWLSQSYGEDLRSEITEKVQQLGAWNKKKPSKNPPPSPESRDTVAFQWAKSQVEEIFCDLIGLLMFRESYLHAFRYLLATDFEHHRSGHYPPIGNRIEILCGAAKKAGVKVQKDFKEGFNYNTSTQIFLPLQDVIQAADDASRALADRVYRLAKEIVDERKLCESTPAGVALVLEHFERLVPARGAKCFADIINAAWEFELRKKGRERLPDHKEREVSLVSELTFKTCEVFQIESHVHDT